MTTQGLTGAEVRKLQDQYGKNELTPAQSPYFFRKVLHILSEPMFLLLLVAAVIYFVLGEACDGAIMLLFVVGIISIDVIQQWKTDRTLTALRDLSAPHITVIRDGVETLIPSADLVQGDFMLLAEGIKIPADGTILRANDLCVDESSLTGEADGVWKSAAADVGTDHWRRNVCYAGTLVTQGSALVRVDAIGTATEYGKIGAHVAAALESPSPLQKQTGGLVKLCAGIAAVLFAAVGAVTWFNIPDHLFGARIIESVLSGITLAMAMIPEEFPVILTVFLSMGAWRLAKQQSLVRSLPAVETLGAVSVLCVDKTGTITMNQMTVREVWSPDGETTGLIEAMGLACETDAYDPMEQAMLAHCDANGFSKAQLFDGELLTEYPFTNALKMMGHVWRRSGKITIAAKGSPERILPLCMLTDPEREAVDAQLRVMSEAGLRVIAVGTCTPANTAAVPAALTDCTLTLCGLIGLADPPRASVKDDIAQCTRAGVRVVMITGDNGVTASSIARQIGMPNCDHILTGDELDEMSDEVLRERVRDVSIFSRVVPEHKMRIVKAFQANGEVVAMTGDGVNDAPALKHADIGIAMGKRGCEVSREAADLILLDDNFSTIVHTIQDGRRIYDNIRKAVGYVFTIHLPIACASLLAPILGIAPANLLLLPLHVVLLELIIDPTCSIVLERQPAERDSMERPPRDPRGALLSARGLVKSIAQGLVLFAASFGGYFFTLQRTGDAALARSMGISIIMLGNLFLVLVLSSDTESVLYSLRKLAHDRVMWLVGLGILLGLTLILYTPLHSLLKLAPLDGVEVLAVLGISALSVLWYDLIKRIKTKSAQAR